MSINKERLLQIAKKLGITFENEEAKVEEIIEALKEYGIQVTSEEEYKQSFKKSKIFEAKPRVEWCGPFPDGKEKRRDRRRQERLLKKRKS